MDNEEMKRSLRELCRIESVAGIDVSDDAPYGAGCAQADVESGKLKTAVSLTVHGGFLNYSGFMLVRIDNACPMR